MKFHSNLQCQTKPYRFWFFLDGMLSSSYFHKLFAELAKLPSLAHSCNWELINSTQVHNKKVHEYRRSRRYICKIVISKNCTLHSINFNYEPGLFIRPTNWLDLSSGCEKNNPSSRFSCNCALRFLVAASTF